LGWSIIGVATILGAIMAYNSAIGAQEDFQKGELNQLTKKMHQQLNQAVLERNVDTVLHQTASYLASAPEKESELFDQINKPIISVFHNRKLNNVQSGLRFMSFFNSNKTSEYDKSFALESGLTL
jgi:hypothetical protein